MPRRMVVVNEGGDESGGATVFVEAASPELALQERMKANPDLLPVEDFGMSSPMLVVGRETILESGAVDLLGLTRRGDLLVIEFKTGPQNPDFRHALAQVLHYGSDLWQLDYETFERRVARPYFSSARCVGSTHNADSLGSAAKLCWPDLSVEEWAEFQDRLEHALAHGSFHYVIVAQRLTPTMERAAEYLNALCPNAFFYLVELVHFSDGNAAAFEARTVYRPSITQPKPGSAAWLDEQTFLESLADEQYRATLEQFFETCRGLGLRFEWGTKGTSIRLLTTDKAEPVSVAWVFPPGVSGWMGLTDVTLGYAPSQARNAPSAQPGLEAYRQSVGELPGATPVTKAGLTAYGFSPAELMQSAGAITGLLTQLTQALAGVDESA